VLSGITTETVVQIHPGSRHIPVDGYVLYAHFVLEGGEAIIGTGRLRP
jgi:hypothetical protein